MPKIEAFVLDFDGVLADSNEAHTVARLEAFRRLGYSATVNPALHDEAHKQGSHAHEIIGWILIQAGIVAVNADVTTDETVEKVVATKNAIYREETAAGLEAIPRSLDFVRMASSKYGPEKLAIATTASRENEVLPYLRRHGVVDMFGHIVGQEDTPQGAMKPDPFVYDEAVRRIGLPPERIAAVEDSPRGIQAARDAGVYVFGVATTHSFDELSAANQVIGSFQVLNQMIRN